MDFCSFADNDVLFRIANSRTAKRLCLSVIFVVIIYHVTLKLHFGEDSCVGLFEDGRYQGNFVWQPYGCMLHTYSVADTKTCMRYNQYFGRNNNFMFIGGLRMRQVYEAFLLHLGPPQPQTTEMIKPGDSKTDANLFLDHSINLTAAYHRYSCPTDELRSFLKDLALKKQRPKVLLLSLGVDCTVLGEDAAVTVENFSENLAKIVPYLRELVGTTQIFWLDQGPINESKLKKNETSLSNSFIWHVNQVAEKQLRKEYFRIWTSAGLLTLHNRQFGTDGVSLGTVAVNYSVQILLNSYCNDQLNFPDGTCCSRGESIVFLQLFVLGIFVFCVVASCCLTVIALRPHAQQEADSFLCCQEMPRSNMPTSDRPPSKLVFKAFANICLILILCFVCDRTSMFMKENKWFTMFNFFLPICYIGVLGVFLTENSGHVTFMHDEQLDEFRGWMLLVVLTYNMTGAHGVVALDVLRQCMISGYLFILGYTHFWHYFSTGDFSLRRLLRVLIKYNGLAVALCVTLNRPYQFYAIAPLFSYWFLVVYLTLAVPPHLTVQSANPVNYLWLAVKCAIAIGLISVLYLSEVFFERVFVMRPWRPLFVYPEDSVHVWWTRWRQDRYTAVAGVIFGMLSHIARRYIIMTDGQPTNLFSRRLSGLAGLISLGGLGAYVAMVTQCRSLNQCSEWHAYVSFIPIVSYLILRNLLGCVRVRISTLFSWFGKISIEMLIAQYHVWLAADGNGVLVLFPRWPVFNVMLTTCIFACLAHELQGRTRTLVHFLMPPEPRLIIRNLLLVLLFFVFVALVYDSAPRNIL